jgi:hypothetical protein
MFREWRWWKQYHPSCEIGEKGKLRITKISNMYFMKLKIEVKYTSRDNRHDTRMDISTILLDVYNMGKGRDSKPYRLCRSAMPFKIHPIEEDDDGVFLVMSFSWYLPCRESVVIRYDFLGDIDAPPLVGTSTSCKILAIGKAKIEGIPKSRQLKVDDKFLVQVDKEYEE